MLNQSVGEMNNWVGLLPENGRFLDAGSFELEEDEQGYFESSLVAVERCTVDRNSEELRKVEENEDVLAFEASGGLEQTEEEQSVSAAEKASAAGAKRCRESGSANRA